jgi:ribosomal protein L2
MAERITPDILRLADIDNVAVALRALEAGETVSAGNARVTALGPIAAGHKLALREIPAGEAILKYGQVMGRATARIAAGEHVHVHNVEGLRGRGDLAPLAAPGRG